MLPRASSHNDAQIIADEFRDYAYSVSHDLGAPIRAVIEFSKLLNASCSEALRGEDREFLSLIVGQGQKLQKMMDGLLDYSRLNTMVRPFVKTDFNAIFESVCASLKNKIKISRAVIHKENLPVLFADSQQIERIFAELLDNAMKFQPQGNIPKISVFAAESADEWMISIVDNGIGIDLSQAPRIFKMFQRLHGDDDFSGNGVGLALAQKIMQRHGGRIWFEKNLAGGSIFCLALAKAERP